MALNIQPFQFAYQPPQVRAAQSITTPTWGPVDVSKQLQEGISNVLPQMAKAYQGVKEEVQRNKWADQVDAFGNKVDVNGTPAAQAQAAVGLGQQGGAYAKPAAPSFAGGAGGGRNMAMPVTPEIKTGISQAANALGISPVDLATAISYETGGTYDPTKAGPTTQWGQHRGLIQFGQPQAAQYGVNWKDPVASQLGENGAIVKYLRDRGVKPGMGMLDIYSAINAGSVGLYDRSDAKNGGAPGTVRDKVEQQMAGHRARAERLFADAPAPVPQAAPQAAPVAGPAAAPAQAAPVQSIPGDDPVKLRADAAAYAKTNPEAARQMLARAEAAEAQQRQAAPQAAAPAPIAPGLPPPNQTASLNPAAAGPGAVVSDAGPPGVAGLPPQAVKNGLPLFASLGATPTEMPGGGVGTQAPPPSLAEGGPVMTEPLPPAQPLQPAAPPPAPAPAAPAQTAVAQPPAAQRPPAAAAAPPSNIPAGMPTAPGGGADVKQLYGLLATAARSGNANLMQMSQNLLEKAQPDYKFINGTDGSIYRTDNKGNIQSIVQGSGTSDWKVEHDSRGNWAKVNQLTGEVLPIDIGGGAGKGPVDQIIQTGDTALRQRYNIPDDGRAWRLTQDKEGNVKPEPIANAEDPDSKGFERESGLRKEFEGDKQVKDYRTSTAAFDQLKRSADEGNGVGDVSLIYQYMKILDPDSVVREGEFALAGQTSGAAGQAANLYNKLLTGERLSDKDRTRFVNMAGRLLEGRSADMGKRIDYFDRIAKSQKVKSENVIGGIEKYAHKPWEAPTNRSDPGGVDTDRPFTGAGSSELKPMAVEKLSETSRLPAGTWWIQLPGENPRQIIIPKSGK